ncbi:E3 SUMO-protein ligase RanBP2-like [Montipora foliosa]|uniref:E3 SUMO-protein ligase RanBP2-like n=1 Tax=Montipora foliosa TaxID=591990 RepID=UPI0035F128B6
MVWTKDDVDKYVVQVERNCKNAHERNLKGFAFARLYKEAADNESAKRYLEAYISESEGDFRGHCLMGQLHESTGQLEKAVASYRRSLELNNTQKELVLKVVKLYCRVPVHPDRARAWADRAARLFPGHSDVFNLKLYLLESAPVVDYEALEDLLSEEVSKRPRDVHLHVRLVRLYAVRGRLDESFSHCVAVWKTKAFKESFEWVSCCVEIFERYLSSLEKAIKDETIGSGNAIVEVHSFLLIVLCQFVELHLAETGAHELINALYRLDHSLHKAHQLRIRQSPRHSTSGGPTEWEVILTEMKAQLYLYCGTSLIWLAKEKFVTWPRGLKLASACYLASVSIVDPETKTQWVARAPKNRDPLKWYVMACSRLSQVGHFLMATRDRHGPLWMNTCHSDCCSRQGLQEILSTVYRGEKDLTKSFLASDGDFSGTKLAIPAVEQLVAWDEVALSESPRSLQNIVWVGLHWFQFNKDMKPGVGVMVKNIFQELRPDVPNIEKHISSNMLCLRDIEAFVYAVVRTTAKRILEDRDIFYEDYEPQVLPLPLCPPLSLPVQAEWWIAAYNLYTGKFSVHDSGKIHHTVQLGMEKIRALGERHGLQVQLLMYLGNTFGSKATFLKGSVKNPWYYEEHWKSLERWSMHYLCKALTILEKLERDENIPHCDKPLFPHMFDALLDHEIKLNLESVRLALGGALMKEGKLFDAMDMFEQVKTPPGMYNLAQVYKYLAHVEARAATEETDTESACPTKEYYQNLREAYSLLQAYLKMTNPADVGRNAVLKELKNIEALIQSGFPPADSQSGQHGNVLQQNYLESQSSTNASDAQDSDDNFWPSDQNTKDFIATLSEVALNKGYFQEQMALRDEAMSLRDETITSMREEIDMLKKQVTMLQSAYDSTLNTPSYSASSGVADHSKPLFESTPLTSKQTPLSRISKPVVLPSIKGPLKIDTPFFAGLSSSNSPEKRIEELGEPATSPTSHGRVRHDSSTSYTEDIHFEPLIPLPEEIEVHTGEEEEEELFNSRAKLYRYDKDVAAWKDRGIGTMKILHSKDKGRSRVLMRREVVHKICANHIITNDMKLEEKKGTTNTLIWSTLADYSEEVVRPEQLAVKFKTQDEVLLFKKAFEECQQQITKGPKLRGSIEDARKRGNDLLAKFAPKPGTWSCAVCLINNEEHSTLCIACGAAKLPAKTEFNTGTHEDVLTRSAPLAVSSSSGSPFVFKIGDSASGRTSPFEFNQTTNSSSSPFAFRAPSSGASGRISPLFSMSSPQGFLNSEHPSSGPFVLASFGVPAVSSVSSQSPFTFSNAVSTQSSPFFPPVIDQAAHVSSGTTSVFGGGSPEQAGPALSFGSFGTGTSPRFDLNVSSHSTSGTQTDPLKCDKCDGDQFSPRKSTQNQLESAGSFGMPDENQEITQQRLFWQQPSSFQFGKPESFPTLGGSSSADISNYWQQVTSPLFQPPTSERAAATNTSHWFLSPQQVGYTLNTNTDPSSSQCHHLQSTVKHQQDAKNQKSQSGGYDFSPYILDEPSEDVTFHTDGKPLPSAAIEEQDTDDEGSEETTDERSKSLTETDGDGDDDDDDDDDDDGDDEDEREEQDDEKEKEEDDHKTRPEPELRRLFLVAKSPLKGTKKQDEDCIIVYEVRASMADRQKAAHLLLPPNFFNYTKREPFPGCIGCGGVSQQTRDAEPKESEESKEFSPAPDTTEVVAEPSQSASTSHVFGQVASFGQLTFSSFVQNGVAFAHPKTSDVSRPFQGAGTQLFAEPTQSAEGQNDDGLHFEPVIPLPDEIEVVTGEEGLEVLFSERAKLYRFDVDSVQWKERGTGEMKLLRHPTSGRGRVLMRREQIKKLCANHNIAAAMELKPNVGSDRSWVWFTSADYAEGEPKPEKLAVKFKTAETARKFKEVFDDLKESSPSEPMTETTEAEDQKDIGCKLYNQFFSKFVVDPGACYIENKAEDSSCVACETSKPGFESVAPQLQAAGETTLKPSLVESIEPVTFQDSNKASPASSGFVFQPFGIKELSSSTQLFTIGRVDRSEDTVDDDIGISPRKTTSPSKQGMTPPQKVTTPPQNTPMIGPFGIGTLPNFTFSLVASPGSLVHEGKSPTSHSSPASPESPGRRDDDGPHFEPLIPLPEKVECRTGEEGEEVLFCERCKLFRYDGEASEWKERGIGDIKILRNTSSGKCRVLMRREQIFKLCANHMISADVELKPFPNSDKAWLWTTFADFSDDIATAETLAARFKTSEIASQFKETFYEASNFVAFTADETESSTESGQQLSDQAIDQEIVNKIEKDVTIVFEKHVSEDQKERAKRLVLPSNFFGYEQTSETYRDEQEEATSEQEEAAPQKTPEEKTATQSVGGFLFGSPSVSSLSFQSVAATLGDSPFGKKAQDKSSGFVGSGSQLFTPHRTDDNNDDNEDGDPQDGPHFEPIIPLPDKIEVKTGEENEEVMFSHRAKLYRYVTEEKQWKERGVGDIKLLRNTFTGKIRVLMRREQVLKICANHQITTDMKLQPNAGSERSWVWSTAADFSEEECKAERLAVKFKNEEIAKQFKEKFEECQEILKNHVSLKVPGQEENKEDKPEKQEDILAKFRPAEGSWECDICFLRNGSDKMQCAACANPKPGAETIQNKISKEKFEECQEILKNHVSLKVPGQEENKEDKPEKQEDILAKFRPAEGSWECDICFLRNGSDTMQCAACANPKPGAETIQNKISKEKFEECQEILKNHVSLKVPGQEENKEDKPEKQEDILAKFRPAEGSWECDICFLRNGSDTMQCAACANPKPGAETIQNKISKEKFEECQEILKNHVSLKVPGQEENKEEKPEKQEDILAKFRPAEGSWECDICFLRNGSDKMQCAACANPKPGAETIQNKISKEKFEECQEILKNHVSLKVPGQEENKEDKPEKQEDILAKFRPAEGSWECDICFLRNGSDKMQCAACANPKPGAETIQNKTSSEKPQFPFGFGAMSSGSGITFGSFAPSSDSTAALGSVAKSSNSGFAFGSAASGSNSGSVFAPSLGSEVTFGLGAGGFKFGFRGETAETKPFNSSFEDLTTRLKQDESATEAETKEDEKNDSKACEESVEEEVKLEEASGGATAGGSKNEDTEPATERESPIQVKQNPEVKKEEKFLFGSASISSLSFHSVAASSSNSSPFGQKITSKSSGFEGAGSKLFGSQTPLCEEHEVDYGRDDDGPHFEPIIPLPDKIEVKTGEENEEVMFSHRAKLYRYVTEEKQWKERGVGDIKLLRNTFTGKIRVLMRREQVLKICANHQITTDMKLQPNAASERSWVWSTAADFSEEECKAERLAVRFKNEETATQFKEKFEECQEILKDHVSLQLPVQEENKEGKAEEQEENILAKFRPAEGSWECEMCLLRNGSDKIQCAACANPKPGVKIQEANTGESTLFGSGAASSGAGFSFSSGGLLSSEGFSFVSSAAGFSFGLAKTTANDEKPVFSFGLPSLSSSVNSEVAKQSDHTAGTQQKIIDEPSDSSEDNDEQTVEEKRVASEELRGSKEETSVNFVKDGEQQEKDVRKDLLEKCEPKEGSCDVDNDECGASESGKAATASTQAPFNFENSLLGSDESPTGKGFSFGSGAPSTDPRFIFKPAVSSEARRASFEKSSPSTASNFSFGSSTPGPTSAFTFVSRASLSAVFEPPLLGERLPIAREELSLTSGLTPESHKPSASTGRSISPPSSGFALGSTGQSSVDRIVFSSCGNQQEIGSVACFDLSNQAADVLVTEATEMIRSETELLDQEDGGGTGQNESVEQESLDGGSEEA